MNAPTAAELATALQSLASGYATQFDLVGQVRHEWLEVGGLVWAAKQYESKGFTVAVANRIHGIWFRVKKTVRGRPDSYSYFEITRTQDGTKYELRLNHPVENAACDGSEYCADIAVLRPQPRLRKAAPHSDLISFVESKSLAIYPMLAAQAVGIAHELAPGPLPRIVGGNTIGRDHFEPTFVVRGAPSKNVKQILTGFKVRGYGLQVIPEFDTYLHSLTGPQATANTSSGASNP